MVVFTYVLFSIYEFEGSKPSNIFIAGAYQDEYSIVIGLME
jgi:hypothetical protein